MDAEFLVVSQFENRCSGSPPVARSDCIEHAGKIPLSPPLTKGEARRRGHITSASDSTSRIRSACRVSLSFWYI